MMDSATPSLRAKRYEAEDTTPTTEKELRGWYSYGIAAEVFAVCGVGSFLPVTLEQLARETGVLRSDRVTPCVTYSSSAASRLLGRAADHQGNDQCLIHIFGSDVSTGSFAMYTFSIGVFVQALVLVSFSAFADHGGNRKRLLLGFGFTGAVASMLFMLVVPSIYLLGALLSIIGVACLGSSFVLLNSFLPLLVANHPSVRAHHHREVDDESTDASALSEIQISTRISSKGVGLGYAAAVFVQCLSVLLLFTMSKLSSPGASKSLPFRLVLFMSGVWWLAFTIPSALWLRTRPGPPLLTSSQHHGTFQQLLGYVAFAWKSLWRTIRVAAKLRQTSVFLLAWFLLSDAVATVSGTAIIFARTELELGSVGIALLSITVTTFGILGAALWPRLSQRFKWRTNRTIVTCMLLMEVIPIYGLLGFLPFVQSWGVGGLQQPWEIYPLGIIHGTVMGGLSSYCRSFFGHLIPPGNEAAFYALFAITDKGSSVIGPAIVGSIVDATGSIRPAFFFLAILIALPMPLMWNVDAEKGQEEATKMALVLNESGPSPYDIELRAENQQESEGLMAGPE